jgi:hypothetical protein
MQVMAWRDRIAGCFGVADAKFALHPADEDRARDAIREAKADGATRDDFEKELLWYVYQRVRHHNGFWKLVDSQKKTLDHIW